MEWQDVLEHPSLRDLPFKIETNEWGQVVMSPATNKHSLYQGEFVWLLRNEMGGGRAFTECSLDTPKGVKVADVVWTSEAFIGEHGEQTPYPQAPEICVEIISPSNTQMEMQEKITLYLAKGAREVWLCEDGGRVRFFGHKGEMERSNLAPDFPTSVTI